MGEGTVNNEELVAAKDGKRGCPVTRWDGPYSFRCDMGIDECATHGPFDVVPADSGGSG